MSGGDYVRGDNVLDSVTGTYCYVAVCRHGRPGRLGGARRFGAHRGRRGAGAYCGGFPHSLIIKLLQACLNL